jgi:signal transduction histidine kinase
VTDAVQSRELEGRRRAFVDGIVFRCVGYLVGEIVTVAAALCSDVPFAHFVPILLLGPPLAAMNTIYWYAGRARGFPLRDFYVHWMVDLVAISYVIFSLGGLDVPYGPFLYSMIVITSAMFVSRAGSYAVATGAAVCLVGMAAGLHLGVLPTPARVWGHHYSAGGELTVIAGAIIFFFMNAYLAGTLSDQLKTAKGQIEEQNLLLEQRVQERTQLLEARTQQLQERTDELQEIVHIVTHDLQNVAVAGTETARKLVELDGGGFSERGRRYADRLVRDCRLMATMLRNLLEVVNQTEVADHRELVDVAGVVEEAINRAHTMIDGKGIEVTVGDVPPLYAEQQKLHHVFDNLVTNACKYVGDKTPPRIEIGGAVHNGSVEYFVRDNGIGIDAGQLGRIFQLYHRAPEQTVAGVTQQGHGIGLAVVKRIVQRYGGRIWVESVPGEGSSFHLSFPRDERA